MRVLTGIKPTGTVHLGNYVGAIKPAIATLGEPGTQGYLFIADYHALTTLPRAEDFRRQSYGVAATWLAAGLDPETCTFYRQSDVPEIFELTWIIACHCPKSMMNRAHAYKAMVQANEAAGQEDVDAGVNMGLYSYPVLMAADILAFDSNVVPVGRDQAQHVEYARDLAIRMNHRFIEENAAPADVLTVPEARIDADIAAIPGLDGRKMSKSYNNVIPLYGTARELEKAVKRIVTDSRMPGEPKDPETSNVYQIYAAFAGRAERELFASDLRAGLSWGDAKKRLFTLLDQELAPGRDTYQALMADPARIDAILAAGAEKARREARKVLNRVRAALGLR